MWSVKIGDADVLMRMFARLPLHYKELIVKTACSPQVSVSEYDKADETKLKTLMVSFARAYLDAPTQTKQDISAMIEDICHGDFQLTHAEESAIRAKMKALVYAYYGQTDFRMCHATWVRVSVVGKQHSFIIEKRGSWYKLIFAQNRQTLTVTADFDDLMSKMLAYLVQGCRDLKTPEVTDFFEAYSTWL